MLLRVVRLIGPTFERWESAQKANASADAPAIRPRTDQLARDEEYKLVQNIFLQSASARRQVVLFAEVERNPGGAFVCGRTAEVLEAQGEGSVCLVDLDFREPSLHQRFHTTGARGLLDALRDGGPARSAMQQVGSNLWLLPSGSPLAHPHTALSSDRVRLLFKDLRAEFDYVLISAPPFSQCAESMLLSQLSDGVVLVVEAHATRRERARTVKERLTAAQIPLLGVVLNNRTFPIPDALYRRI